jgi:hypothetical protein
MPLVRVSDPRRGVLMRRNTMLSRGRGLRGLGDDCGADPCTWWDQVYMRDACLAYKTCVNPNDPEVVLVNKGLLVGGAQVAGTAVGQTAGTAIESTVTGLFTNPDAASSALPGPLASVNWVMVGGAFLGLLLLPKLLKV